MPAKLGLWAAGHCSSPHDSLYRVLECPRDMVLASSRNRSMVFMTIKSNVFYDNLASEVTLFHITSALKKVMILQSR